MRGAWIIEGYDGLQLLFRHELSGYGVTANRIQECLRLLAARSLNEREIFGSIAREGTHHKNHLLDVDYDSDSNTYRCGGNPHFTACFRSSGN